MNRRKPMIVINATHTVAGGGLVYLNNLLPYFAQDKRFRWRLVTTREGAKRLTVPAGIKVKKIPTLRFGLSHLYEQFVLPARACLWGAKLVWSNANYGPLLAPGAMVTIHTTPRAAATWPGLKWRVYWGSLRMLTTLCLWRSSASFSVAEHVVADFLPGPFAHVRKRVRIAPPAVAPFKPKGRQNPDLIVAVGDFYRQKDYPTLLRAMAQLRDERPGTVLEIIGRPVFAEVMTEVDALRRKLGLGENLRIVPGMPHGALLERIGEARVFVTASQAESFNMPVLEAMAAGTPVVAGPHAVPREMVGDAVVWVPPRRSRDDYVRAYVEILMQMMEDDALHETYRKKALKQVKSFGWEKTAALMLDTFAAQAGLHRKKEGR